MRGYALLRMRHLQRRERLDDNAERRHDPARGMHQPDDPWGMAARRRAHARHACVDRVEVQRDVVYPHRSTTADEKVRRYLLAKRARPASVSHTSDWMSTPNSAYERIVPYHGSVYAQYASEASTTPYALSNRVERRLRGIPVLYHRRARVCTFGGRGAGEMLARPEKPRLAYRAYRPHALPPHVASRGSGHAAGLGHGCPPRSVGG